jgi:hypothetical protein
LQVYRLILFEWNPSVSRFYLRPLSFPGVTSGIVQGRVELDLTGDNGRSFGKSKKCLEENLDFSPTVQFFRESLCEFLRSPELQ